MTNIEFNCPECQQSLEAPVEMAGETVACPHCEQHMVVPASAGSPVPDTVGTADNGLACSECAAAMEPDAVLCLQCGYHSGLGKKISTELG